MPVVISQSGQGAKGPGEGGRPSDRGQSSTGSGALSDLKVRIALGVAVLGLLIGLVGWSQGWFERAAPAARPATGAAPAGGNEESNPLGHKRNKGMGE